MELTIHNSAGIDALRQESVNLLSAFLHSLRSSNTRRAYKTALREFFGTENITPALARQCTPIHVNAYLDKLRDDGLRPATWQARKAAIKSFFEYLEAIGGIIEVSPVRKRLLRPPERIKRTARVLSEEDARRLVSVSLDLREQAIVSTFLYCALRRTELSMMNVEHMNNRNGVVVLTIPESKGGSDQIVPIPDHVYVIIRRYMAEEGIEAGPLWRSRSHRNKGGRMTDNGIYSLIKKMAKRAGVDISPHGLRHTSLDLARQYGATPRQAQLLGRHSKIDTTMQYWHDAERIEESAAYLIPNLEE